MSVIKDSLLVGVAATALNYGGNRLFGIPSSMQYYGGVPVPSELATTGISSALMYAVEDSILDMLPDPLDKMSNVVPPIVVGGASMVIQNVVDPNVNVSGFQLIRPQGDNQQGSIQKAAMAGVSYVGGKMIVESFFI